MSLSMAQSSSMGPASLVGAARSHTLLLATMVAGSLLLYAYATARNGHTFRSVDGYLYYTYAHSWYFDGDCDYENNMRLAPGFTAHEHFLQRSSIGRVRNIMPCAWSVIALPFLAIADGLTIAHNAVAGTNIARDGYTGYYRAIVPLPHVLIGTAGLLVIYAILASRFSKYIAAVATVLAWCGTNVIYWISFEPTRSHAASLAFVAGTIWTADTIRRSGWSWRRALALGACCGMMGAVRHQNVAWMAVPIILLAPSMASGVLGRRLGSLRDVGLAALGALIAVLCFLPQFISTWVTERMLIGHTTHWAPHWFKPHFLQEFFHRSTGLVSSYPLAGVALVGVLIYAYRTRRRAFPLAAVAGFAAIAYLNACRWDCHRVRRYVCCVTVFALGLAAILEWASRSRRRTVAVAVVLGALCARNIAVFLGGASPFPAWISLALPGS